MGNTNNKNLFRKILPLKNTENVSENFNRFRKSIDARLASAIPKTPKLERIPGHDVMFFE